MFNLEKSKETLEVDGYSVNGTGYGYMSER